MTAKRTFDDFREGDVFDLGSRTLSRQEIVAFAAEFDPQPMHMDEEAARHTMLGGLAASGWHTAASLMRLLCDGLLLSTASMGSPGIEELKWLKPVRPGDCLSGKATVMSARASAKRPEMGIVQMRFEAANQAGETVISMICPLMVSRTVAP